MKITDSFATFIVVTFACFGGAFAAENKSDLPHICHELQHHDSMSPRAQNLAKVHCVGHPQYCTVFPCGKPAPPVNNTIDVINNSTTIAPTNDIPTGSMKNTTSNNKAEETPTEISKPSLDCTQLTVKAAKAMDLTTKLWFKKECKKHTEYCKVFRKTGYCRKHAAINCDLLITVKAKGSKARGLFKAKCKDHPDYCLVFRRTGKCTQAAREQNSGYGKRKPTSNKRPSQDLFR